MSGDASKSLYITILGKDFASKVLQHVGAEVQSLGSHAGRTATGLGRLSNAGRTLGSNLKSAITSPLGMLGVGGGLFAIGGIVEQSMQKTSDFALSLEKLTTLSGESAQSMGALAIVADKYGIDSMQLAQIVGFSEKALGKLEMASVKAGKGQQSAALAALELRKAQLEAAGASTKHVDALIKQQKAYDQLHPAAAAAGVGINKLQQLQAQYGVQLADSHGKALSFSTVLAHVADYYNSNADAAKKAALASQVFGRGYAAMIPILQLGSAGIQQQKQAVADLGLQLGTDSVGALNAYKQSLRGLGDAINVLEISVGLALAPMFTNLANSITGFLEHGGSKQIVGFFQQGAQFAQDFAAAAAPVGGFFAALVRGWNSLPGPLKTVLIGGFVVNKLTGGLVTGLGKDALGALFKSGASAATGGGIGGALRGIGPQHVWVDNPGFGAGGGGIANDVAAAGEAVGAGWVASTGAVIAASLLPVAVGLALGKLSDPTGAIARQFQADQTSHFGGLGMRNFVNRGVASTANYFHGQGSTGQAGAGGGTIDYASFASAVQAGTAPTVSAVQSLKSALKTTVNVTAMLDMTVPITFSGNSISRELTIRRRWNPRTHTSGY